MLHLSDIKLPEGVEIPQLAQSPDNDYAIVSIHVIKAAPVEEDEVAEDVEATEDGEGESPAEDAAGDESSDD